MRKFAIIPFLALVLLAIAPVAKAETTALGDPITKVSVPVYKSFSVSLGIEETAGYEWRLAKPLNEKIVKFLLKEFVPRTKIPGAIAEEIWTFDAVGKGSTEIVLEYVRPWEKKGRPQAKKLVIRAKIH